MPKTIPTFLSVVEDFRDLFDSLKGSLTVPEETCPTINSIQKNVGCAIGIAADASSGHFRYRISGVPQTLEEAISLLSDIESELYGVNEKLEGIRTANSTLRELGNEWYALAKDALLSLEELAANESE